MVNRPGSLIHGARRPTWAVRVLKFIVLGVSCALIIVPFLAVVSTSLADQGQIADAGGYVLFPESPTIDAYRAILSGGVVTRAMAVSIGVTVVGTLLSLAVVVTMAYSLSRPGSWGQRPALLAVLMTMLFSAGIIPNYLLIKELGLIDSLWALILPGLTSAFQIIIVRTFFLEVPGEIVDAAKIDGASDLQVLVRIMLPLSKAVLAVVGLFSAVAYWNAYFNAVLYIQSPENWPLQLVLRTYVIDNAQLGADLPGEVLPPQQSLQMAILVLSLIPILLVYPFLQKHFAKGLVLGAVKG